MLELLRSYAVATNDTSPWYSVDCIVDPALEPNELVLPSALLGRIHGAIWIATPDAPFFGAIAHVKGAKGSHARISQRSPLEHAGTILLHAVNPRFVDHPKITRPDAPDVSLSIADFMLDLDKQTAARERDADLLAAKSHYDEGLITDGERYNRIVDTNATHAARVNNRIPTALGPKLEKLADAGYVKPRELAKLLGVPGTITKASGEIYERAIWSSAAEGWSPHEYFLLAGGARRDRMKKLTQTDEAQRLWLKLAEIIGDCTITTEDCGTTQGVLRGLEETIRIVGRTLAADLAGIAARGTTITRELIADLQRTGLRSVPVRFLPLCEAPDGVCAKCFGANAKVGDRCGAITARRVAELAATLVERLYMVCGAAYAPSQTSTRAPARGVLRFEHSDVAAIPIEADRETWIVVSPDAELHIRAADGTDHVMIVPEGAELFFAEGEEVEIGDELARWAHWWTQHADLPRGIEARVELINVGDAIIESVDEVTGLSSVRVDRLEPNVPRPAIALIYVEDGRSITRTHPLRDEATLLVEHGALVTAGTPLASFSRSSSHRSYEHSSGLPRLLHLLEAESPPDRTPIVRKKGVVVEQTKRRVVIEDRDHQRTSYPKRDGHGVLRTGDRVLPGDPIVLGTRDHHDLLEVLGPAWLADHLDHELWEALQGAAPNTDSELLTRAMLANVRVLDPGSDPRFVQGQIVPRRAARGLRAEPVLLGISELIARKYRG